MGICAQQLFSTMVSSMSDGHRIVGNMQDRTVFSVKISKSRRTLNTSSKLDHIAVAERWLVSNLESRPFKTWWLQLVDSLNSRPTFFSALNLRRLALRSQRASSSWGEKAWKSESSLTLWMVWVYSTRRTSSISKLDGNFHSLNTRVPSYIQSFTLHTSCVDSRKSRLLLMRGKFHHGCSHCLRKPDPGHYNPFQL